MTLKEKQAAQQASRWVQTVDYAEYPHLKFEEMFQVGAGIYRDNPEYLKAVKAGADWQQKVDDWKAKK